jgi:hypothetical protein
LFDKGLIYFYHQAILGVRFLSTIGQKGNKMVCLKCGQTVMEGSRFCMHCGFSLTSEGTEDKTVLEKVDTTFFKSSEDIYEKTTVIVQGPQLTKPEKQVTPLKPLFFAWFVSLDGPDKGKDYRISKEKTSIGKQETSDIVIKRDFISRNHAVLTYEDTKFVLTDLHSTNHTYVNDEKISKKILKDNDTIRFGEAAYKFKCL